MRLIGRLDRWGGGGGGGRGGGPGHDIRSERERRRTGPGATALTGAGTELVVVTSLHVSLDRAELFEPGPAVSTGNVVALAAPAWASLVVADNTCNTLLLSQIFNNEIEKKNMIMIYDYELF